MHTTTYHQNLAKRLSAERDRRFVGRASERTLFQTALAADQLPFHLLYVFGPGGVGKTTLLRELVRLCQDAQIPAIYLDARNIEPAPESFLNTLRSVMNLGATDSPLQVLAQESERQVLLLDTYEMLASLDDWLREVFLPQLPEHALIVIAGRQPPGVAWRTDPGWQSLLRLLSLRNLSPSESRRYLTNREISVAQHEKILDFTHGHPLALSLIADLLVQGQNIDFQPEAAPDAIKMLLEKFLEEVPSQAHRMALEACAIARLTTEVLLAEMLCQQPDVRELFEWLRGLSFIESGLLGVFPHDSAREVLVADLRWRNPNWYAELHKRARTYYTTRLGQTQGQEQHRVLFDYIFLHRDNPAIRPRFTWQEHRSLLTDVLRDGDAQALESMVRAHEGEESARLASYWLARQPQGVVVFRDTEQHVAGFVMMVALHQASSEELNADPATKAAWHYLQNHAPLRSGEGATFFRFWMARDTYQGVSPTQSLIFITFVHHHRNTPGLAFTFLPCAKPEDWAAMFAYADLARLPEADFQVGGRRYGVYGHDWRVVSPDAWQQLLAQREIAASAAAIPSPTPEPLVVLSQPEFFKAVQDALRNFSRPNALHQNPLLRSRLVVERVAAKAGELERIAALQALMKEAAELLQSSPRQVKCYQALDRTYLHPAPTQEVAAELLDLPFSTFRRHLKTGIKQVADFLWYQEISK